MNCVSEDLGYNRLKDDLIASTGLAFYEDRDKLLTAVIEARLSVRGLRNCSSYSELLADGEGGNAEMDVLIDQLTVGETSFFRDAEQFAAIRDVILPDILERNRSSRRLRIWSAGCSSGAEPYSLAILLERELGDRIAGWQIEIDATDLNRHCLAQAAEGRFRAWALRTTSANVKKECFSMEGVNWTIHPQFKRWISFHYMNLVGGEFSTPLNAGAHFDLILCRNVMIYFAPEVIRRVIGQLHQSLEDQGWLVVGLSEHNVENFKAFRRVDSNGARFYQKVPDPPPRVQAAVVVELTAVIPEPQPLAAALRPPAGNHTADMEGLRQLADRGDWQAAAEYGQRLLARDKLNPAVHFYQALIFEKLGIVDQSERSLRQAIYLDRNFALAHYHLGLALKRDRQVPGAARSFGNVLKVLAGIPDHEMVTAGPGITVTDLKELAKMHLENPSARS